VRLQADDTDNGLFDDVAVRVLNGCAHGEGDACPEVQRSPAQRAGKMRTIERAHSPFLSRPAKPAVMLREELDEAAKNV
jgi:hypothetical protein